jgi:hypothetical protein
MTPLFSIIQGVSDKYGARIRAPHIHGISIIPGAGRFGKTELPKSREINFTSVGRAGSSRPTNAALFSQN